MKRARNNMTVKIIIGLAIVFSAACRTPRPGVQSATAGVTAQTLENEGSQTPAPRYSEIAKNGSIKLTLLFSFDYDTGRQGFWSNRRTLRDVQSQQNPDDPSYESSWDRATSALAEVRQWFYDEDANDGMYICDSFEYGSWSAGEPNPDSPTPSATNASQKPYYLSTIHCEGPSYQDTSGKSRARWTIRFFLSSPEALAPHFGNAIAADDIVLLNGHFYPYDAAAAEQGNRSWSRSKVYGPALESMEATMMDTPRNGYRIVIFNGCKSEPIEDQVFCRAKKLNFDENLEMVANRGLSNYRFFQKQIPAFLDGLNKGQRWFELLRSFSIQEGTQGSYDRSVPVFRNHLDRYRSDISSTRGDPCQNPWTSN